MGWLHHITDAKTEIYKPHVIKLVWDNPDLEKYDYFSDREIAVAASFDNRKALGEYVRFVDEVARKNLVELKSDTSDNSLPPPLHEWILLSKANPEEPIYAFSHPKQLERFYKQIGLCEKLANSKEPLNQFDYCKALKLKHMLPENYVEFYSNYVKSDERSIASAKIGCIKGDKRIQEIIVGELLDKALSYQGPALVLDETSDDPSHVLEDNLRTVINSSQYLEPLKSGNGFFK